MVLCMGAGEGLVRGKLRDENSDVQYNSTKLLFPRFTFTFRNLIILDSSGTLA